MMNGLEMIGVALILFGAIGMAIGWWRTETALRELQAKYDRLTDRDSKGRFKKGEPKK